MSHQSSRTHHPLPIRRLSVPPAARKVIKQALELKREGLSDPEPHAVKKAAGKATTAAQYMLEFVARVSSW